MSSVEYVFSDHILRLTPWPARPSMAASIMKFRSRFRVTQETSKCWL